MRSNLGTPTRVTFAPNPRTRDADLAYFEAMVCGRPLSPPPTRFTERRVSAGKVEALKMARAL